MDAAERVAVKPLEEHLGPIGVARQRGQHAEPGDDGGGERRRVVGPETAADGGERGSGIGDRAEVGECEGTGERPLDAPVGPLRQVGDVVEGADRRIGGAGQRLADRGP